VPSLSSLNPLGRLPKSSILAVNNEGL